ncbi:MAG: glycosyltransferase family 4 protein [Gaiellaceae bacterium]
MRSVLHVLPHPGGGGETYVDLLERMDGYRFERRYIAGSPLERRPDRLLGGATRALAAARSHDVVHVHGEIAAFLSLPALAAKPSLVTLHGINVLRRSSGPKAMVAKANLRAIVRAATRTICVSETERDEVERVLGARAAEKVALVPNGVRLPAPPGAREAARRELRVPESAVVALAVGGLEPVKDPLTAARAAMTAARDSELVLLFAGDGPLRPELERLATGEGGQALRVLGRLADVDRIYAASDILVVASQREGTSFASLEAMAHGLPLIVADGPGCAEAAGDAAVIARHGDPDSFAAALRRLAADPADRASRGERGRERAAELFSADEMIAQTRALYEEVAAS